MPHADGNRKFWTRRAASGLAYGLLIGLIGITSLVALDTTGVEVNCLFDKTASRLGDNPRGILGCGGGINDFDFVDVLEQEPSTELVSNTITLELTTPGQITVSNATFIRNGDDNGATSLTFSNGDTMALKATTPGAWGQANTAVVSAGKNNVDWVIATRAQDIEVTLSGGFDPLVGSDPATQYTSNTITVTDFDPGGVVAIAPPGAILIINGVPLGEGPVELQPGDTVAVQITTPANFTDSETITVTIGDQQVDWPITNRAADTSVTLSAPFTALTEQEPGGSHTSNTITVGGFDPVGIYASSDPGVDLIHNGVNVGQGPVELNPGDTIALSMAGPSGFEQTVSTVVTIGDQSPGWSVTTRGNDLSPLASGSLGSINNIAPSSSQTSNAITLTDFDGSLSVTATNGAAVQVNSGSGWNYANSVVSGDQVRLVMTANSGYNSTKTATFTVGDYTSPNFSVHTYYYTTGSATGYGSCSGPCSSTSTQYPTGWTCNRSDGTSGYSSSFCSSPGGQSCQTSTCLPSNPPVSGTGGSSTTVNFTQPIRITCSADGAQANYVDSVSVTVQSNSSAYVHLNQIRTPSTGRIGQGRVYFSVSGGNIYPTSMSVGYNGKQHMCWNPSAGVCDWGVYGYQAQNCSSPIACQVWNLSTGQKWYFVRGVSRSQSYVSWTDNAIMNNCGQGSGTLPGFCWQNGSC